VRGSAFLVCLYHLLEPYTFLKPSFLPIKIFLLHASPIYKKHTQQTAELSDDDINTMTIAMLTDILSSAITMMEHGFRLTFQPFDVAKAKELFAANDEDADEDWTAEDDVVEEIDEAECRRRVEEANNRGANQDFMVEDGKLFNDEEFGFLFCHVLLYGGASISRLFQGSQGGSLVVIGLLSLYCTQNIFVCVFSIQPTRVYRWTGLLCRWRRRRRRSCL
jgi:hypothetical protein